MQPTNEQIASELSGVCQQWDRAIAHNNIIEMEKFMSEGWVIVGTDGGISSKPRFFDFVKSGDLIHTQMDFSDIRIKVYDNTSVVTSKGTSSGTYKGTAFSYHEWSTSVFIKDKGTWLCVLTMLTPAEK